MASSPHRGSSRLCVTHEKRLMWKFFELEDLSVWDGFEGVKSFEVEFLGVGNSTGGVVLELVMVRVLDLVPKVVRIGCLDECVVGELFLEVWRPGSMMTSLELGVDELGVGWLKRSGAVWVNWQPEYVCVLGSELCSFGVDA
ncbi:hypothetical protein Droror1_Dr00020434, partial [Drosera rotundifolia]